MSLLLYMAWRNIWRSPWRSGVVVGAMALGVWAGIFMMGLAQGVNDTRTANALEIPKHGRPHSTPIPRWNHGPSGS